ncbi:DNA polymerase III subunit theta [Rosenbergiella australiborealis]|uniref:DNA polymerase III subunit theta n=1 Tax=Rosenbergiella australiborealis TaxID=1544696 RepID=A0ABS5T1R9_9GAMM|nr:DNA polymerase III subunit theta [Rosenbergiella australiborealis]MBT0726276.1 DNA polymerase III subunit theta [Rosenbergiella australiborealis]
MTYNLAELSSEDKDRLNTELAAAGVAFKERYNMPVVPVHVENEQPAALRAHFQQKLMDYRQLSVTLSRLPYEPKLKT